MPHHKLIAYEVALELVVAVKEAGVRDEGLRDQAMRAAKSAALNTAEAAGRSAPRDKARVFVIARGEATEAAAAIEIAVACGDSSEAARDRVVRVARRLTAMLTGLIRR
jgi:four helix bundle protein